MESHKFKLSHSLLGTAGLLLVEFILVYFTTPLLAEIGILALATIGTIVNIYVATEAIEEVQGSRHMFIMLTVILVQFVVFFAFEYGLLLMVQPGAFPTLTKDPIDLMLTSLMVFVFNPLNMPGTDAGRLLLIINAIGGLGLVLFVLQNISQFRRKSLDAHE